MSYDSRKIIYNEVAVIAKKAGQMNWPQNAGFEPFTVNMYTTKNVVEQIALMCSGFAKVKMSCMPAETMQSTQPVKATSWTLTVTPTR